MSATMDSLLGALAPWLDEPANEDVCIQEPEVVWCRSRGQWTRHNAPGVDADLINDIAIVAGAQRRRNFGHDKPILGIEVPYGTGLRRLHAVGEPHVDSCTNLVLRQWQSVWPTMDELRQQGMFRATQRSTGKRPRNAVDDELRAIYRTDPMDADLLLRVAARNRRTIILAGTNGSGKTHMSRALIGQIPLHRRLIVIENARELKDIPHSNRVCLYYAKDDETGVQPTDLVEAALRLCTEQIFLQEIRDGKEALAFMIAGQTGHRGAITTIHAGSCTEVTDRMKAAIKMTPEGRGWSNEDVERSLRGMVDVIAHLANEDDTGRAVDEIHYNDPDDEA